MNDTIERSVTVNAERELYVIDGGDHYSCYGFDNAQDEIERIAIELVGRGFISDFPDMEEIVARAKAQRGTLAAYDTLVNLREKLREVCDEQGERAVAGLTPQLMGLEGHRVEVVTTYNETRRFIVGKSTGWMPCHLEIKRRNSHGGGAAEREYKDVRDLGKVR